MLGGCSFAKLGGTKYAADKFEMTELVNSDTQSAVKTRFLTDKDKIFESNVYLIKVNGKICAIYRYHFDRQPENEDGTEITGYTEKLILVKKKVMVYNFIGDKNVEQIQKKENKN